MVRAHAHIRVGKAWEDAGTGALLLQAGGLGSGGTRSPWTPSQCLNLPMYMTVSQKNVSKEEYEGRKSALFSINSAKPQGGEVAARSIMMR